MTFQKILTVILTVFLTISFLPFDASAASAASPMISYNRSTLDKIVTGTSAEIVHTLTGIPYTNKIEPNDVILIIDRSTSMRNDLDNMKLAAKEFVNSINTSYHRIGVVSYGCFRDIKFLMRKLIILLLIWRQHSLNSNLKKYSAHHEKSI